MCYSLYPSTFLCHTASTLLLEHILLGRWQLHTRLKTRFPNNGH